MSRDNCEKLSYLAGVSVEWNYNQGGIDPAEVVYHVRSQSDVNIIRPPKPILQMIVSKGLPRRQARWCCEYIKEWGGNGRVVILGIRSQESPNRKHRPILESRVNGKNHKLIFNPIIDWSEKEVWEFLIDYKVTYCSLYDEGFKRLGCVLCPMETKGQTQIDLKRFPKIGEAWRRAAFRLYEERKARGEGNSVERWPTFDDMWKWWLSRENKKINKLQGVLMLD